jgi:hypothetical protein
MHQHINLREAERKVFRISANDGLWDILLGCFFLMFAIAPFLSPFLGDFWSSAVFVPFLGLAFLAAWLIRKFVVTPRIGVVRFGGESKSRLLKFSVVMLVVNIAAFISAVVLTTSTTVLSGQTTSIRFGLIMLLGFSIAAYFLQFRRLYIYGLLAGLSPLLGEWLFMHGYAPHHGFPVTFGATSTVMILIGLVVFTRLLRNNPLPEEETAAEDA